MQRPDDSPPTTCRRSRPMLLERLRARAPRVHCITNAVAQNFTANMLLAAGAVPSMTIAPEEIGAFRRARRRAAGQSRHLRPRAARGDRDRGRGGASKAACPGCSIRCSSTAAPPRADFARDACRATKPRALRLNRAEFAALVRRHDRRATALARYATTRHRGWR